MLDKPAQDSSVRTSGPLAGFRIVEFAGIGPGPFACLLLDGDVVFAVSTGRVALADPVTDLARIGDAAARTLARAVAIGVHRATVPPGWAGPPAWRDRFGT